MALDWSYPGIKSGKDSPAYESQLPVAERSLRPMHTNACQSYAPTPTRSLFNTGLSYCDITHGTRDNIPSPRIHSEHIPAGRDSDDPTASSRREEGHREYLIENHMARRCKAGMSLNDAHCAHAN